MGFNSGFKGLTHVLWHTVSAAQNKMRVSCRMQSSSQDESELFSHKSVPEVNAKRNLMRKRDV